MSVIIKGTNVCIFPKLFAQCVQERIGSLSLDSGVGLMLHNFRHIVFLYIICWIEDFPSTFEMHIPKCGSPLLL